MPQPGESLDSSIAAPTTVEVVLEIVEAIPPGTVMTYGDVAEAAGLNSARIVGRILSRGAEPAPWHRVVRADGRCAPHIADEQLARLRAEGVPVRGDRVVLAKARLAPEQLIVSPHD